MQHSAHQPPHRTRCGAQPSRQVPGSLRSRTPSELKKLPLEELMDVEITSASRRPEPLFQSSSAVNVITGDEIERAGATNIPDALRLGTEMEVAQIDGHTWGISARGFNTSTANKLQVLMDGRSLYTPLFSGVLWDVQQTFMADLQQIEVIRGPGATLWGANAVNGVINIISKSAKFEYNSFSGFEVQPTGRLTWIPTDSQTVWGAVSRAVRTPTRIDPGFCGAEPFHRRRPLSDFQSRFRIRGFHCLRAGLPPHASERLSIDAAGYYNDYTNLRSVEPVGTGSAVTLENKLDGTSYGGSVAAKWRATDWWEVAGSVSLLQLEIRGAHGSRDTSNGSGEGNDPNCTFVAHSMMDLPWHLKFDTVLRYVGELPDPATPAYFTTDLRLAWSPRRDLEFAVAGRDLLDNEHPEFRMRSLTREVGRGVFATVKWSY